METTERIRKFDKQEFLSLGKQGQRQAIGEQIYLTLDSAKPGLMVPKFELRVISDMMAQWFMIAVQLDSYGYAESKRREWVGEAMRKVMIKIFPFDMPAEMRHTASWRRHVEKAFNDVWAELEPGGEGRAE